MSEPSFDLSGQVVAVAGAGSGGIGTAVCTLAARPGASVLAMDIKEAELDVLDTPLKPTAGPHRLVAADVRDPDQVDAALDGAASLGSLAGMVHVAGGLYAYQWAPLTQLALQQLDEVLELNLRQVLAVDRGFSARPSFLDDDNLPVFVQDPGVRPRMRGEIS